jgi:hypothetical protein
VALVVALGGLFLPAGAAGPGISQDQTVAYVPDFTRIIANPERGFFEDFSGFDHLHAEDFDGDYQDWLASPEYDSWRFGGGYLDELRSLRQSGVTLLEANITLGGHIASPELPESFLAEVSEALQVVRQAKMKISLRMVYAEDWTPPVVEENYLRHIEQIGEIVTENADIVPTLSAGVLGPWGEWHGDDSSVMVDNTFYPREDRPEYGAHPPTTDLDSPEQGAQRYRLVKQLLENTPDTVAILIRYAENLMEIQALAQNPPPGEAPLSQAQLDRLGLHDDSFASYTRSYTRAGGWDDAFYPYWDNGREYLPARDVAPIAAGLETSARGDVAQYGETAWYPDDAGDLEAVDPSLNTSELDADGQLALSEAATRKLTAISRSWDARHLHVWKEATLPASGDGPAESVYTRLDRKLGYRLRLGTAEFAAAAKAGDATGLTATIFNDGYAGLVRFRPVFAVFENGANRYDVELADVDPRAWRSGENTLVTAVTLPADMAPGEYTLALWLPDGYENLRGDPEYSVRFANQDVWDGARGYNALGQIECRAPGVQ